MTTLSIRRFPGTGFGFCILLAACCGVLQADVTGTILGTAKDATGASMPNVTVSATNVETNFTQTAISDVSGDYRILALPVGTYRVEASRPGFRTSLAENVVLQVNQERRVDIVMDVGSLEQHVEVAANTVQVETTSTQLGRVIEGRRIVDRPL